jgi:hypothetical protein
MSHLHIIPMTTRTGIKAMAKLGREMECIITSFLTLFFLV